MNSRPSNLDSPAVRQTKEDRLTTAFMQYLSGTGPFAEWEEDRKTWSGTDPIVVWDAFETEGISELSNFAKMLLTIVVNQAGCERLFSDIGNTQGTRRTRLGLEKLEKITKVVTIFSNLHTSFCTKYYILRSDPISRLHTSRTA